MNQQTDWIDSEAERERAIGRGDDGGCGEKTKKLTWLQNSHRDVSEAQETAPTIL